MAAHFDTEGHTVELIVLQDLITRFDESRVAFYHFIKERRNPALINYSYCSCWASDKCDHPNRETHKTYYNLC